MAGNISQKIIVFGTITPAPIKQYSKHILFCTGQILFYRASLLFAQLVQTRVGKLSLQLTKFLFILGQTLCKAKKVKITGSNLKIFKSREFLASFFNSRIMTAFDLRDLLMTTPDDPNSLLIRVSFVSTVSIFAT